MAKIMITVQGYRCERCNHEWIPRIKIHKDPAEEEKLLNYVTIFDAIGDLPSIKSKVTTTGLTKKEQELNEQQNKNINSGKEIITINKKKYTSFLNKIQKQGKEFQDFIKSKDGKIIGHVARSHQKSDIELYELMGQGETAYDFLARSPEKAQKLIKYSMNSFKDKYRKQSYSMPSTTVFAHLQKDGNRFIHPNQARTITVREAARIQSFPDWFVFAGPMSQQFKQIGNAVPPLLSKNYIAPLVHQILRKRK